MLLVVIARNVREQNEVVVTPTVRQETVQEQTEPENVLEKLTDEEVAEILRQLQMGAEEADWLLENMAEVKQEREKEIEEKKTRLALVEKETQRVRDELDRLAKLAEQLEGTEKTDNVDIVRLKQYLEQRKKIKEQAELELAELQKEAAQDAKSYAIIPYQGKSGTFRRPIYIECRGDRGIIQPEGVELYLSDFQIADRPDNPFDAVLRVIRQYYIETNQIVRGSEPYPLLVIRPSGVETSETTRRAIGSWIKEYGYELVDEDWRVEYPQPSAELKERIEKQLEISRNRMAGYLAAMHAARGDTGHQREQYKLDHRGQLQRADQFGHQSGRSPYAGPSGGARKSAAPQGSGMNRQSGSTTSGSSGRPGAAGTDISLAPEPRNGKTGTDDEEMPESLKAELAARANAGAQMPGTTPQRTPPPTQAVPQSAYAAPNMPGYAFSGQPQSGQLQNGWTPSDTATEQELISEMSPIPQSAWNAQGSAQQQSTTNRKTSENMQSMAGAPSQASAMASQMAATENGPPSPMVANFSNVEERKENWALRGAVPFSSPISRPVKIQCDGNKFVLMPQKGLTQPRVIPITDSVLAASDKLVYEIWEYMDAWGIAGEKMYWRPVLEVTVSPGGEQRFKELQYLLRKSGLAIEQVR